MRTISSVTGAFNVKTKNKSMAKFLPYLVEHHTPGQPVNENSDRAPPGQSTKMWDNGGC